MMILDYDFRFAKSRDLLARVSEEIAEHGFRIGADCGRRPVVGLHRAEGDGQSGHDSRSAFGMFQLDQHARFAQRRILHKIDGSVYGTRSKVALAKPRDERIALEFARARCHLALEVTDIREA